MIKNFLYVVLLIVIPHLLCGQGAQNEFTIGERQTIVSSILEEERALQIYLPPSYFFSDKGTYPVVYLMDGDYNFHYDTGLIELLSSVSGKIPEMIVVGIADKGKTKYRNNCTPETDAKKGGNATNFMAFIEKELKPFINKTYRAANYDILIGHSVGGLFVTNYLLKQPAAFDAYIAIDPALWVGNYEIISRADSTFSKLKELDPVFFISLADTKDMGVFQFVGILDKYFSRSNRWHFLHFENENHNSVGLPTIKSSLESIFSNWEITRKQFYTFKSAQEIINHYDRLSKQFSTSLTIPPSFLGNAMYYYYNRKKEADLSILETGIKSKFPSSIDEFYQQLALNHFENKEYDKAAKIYNDRITENPQSFLSYEGLSKVLLEQGANEKALEASKKAIEIAKECKARQWMLNELISNHEMIKKK